MPLSMHGNVMAKKFPHLLPLHVPFENRTSRTTTSIWRFSVALRDYPVLLRRDFGRPGGVKSGLFVLTSSPILMTTSSEMKHSIDYNSLSTAVDASESGLPLRARLGRPLDATTTSSTHHHSDQPSISMAYQACHPTINPRYKPPTTSCNEPTTLRWHVFSTTCHSASEFHTSP